MHGLLVAEDYGGICFVPALLHLAAEFVPAFTNTQGGPRRNANAQVLDTNRKPIPRLYSGGELGALYSWGYQGGGNILECIVFGHIAGEQVAAQKPWA